MLTVPNLLSAARILLIPVFVALIVHEGSELAGMLLLGVVISTDWVDGYVARRTGQVTELGKLLDPLADRLALAAALIAFLVRDALPLWAALAVLVRDAIVLGMAVWLVVTKGPRIEVSRLGKVATFTLMWGLPLVVWGNFGLPFPHLARICGWTFFLTGLAEYWAAAVAYLIELRRAVRARRGAGG